MQQNQTCPCGSSKLYLSCCGVFITGKEYPKTPEQLMRSRFTAYVLAKYPYIKQTQRGNAAKGFDLKVAEASPIKWLNLTIIATPEPKEGVGIVEFKARYLEGIKIGTYYERSEFQLYKNQWFYTDSLPI